MKRLVTIVLFTAMLLTATSCNDRSANQRAQTLAQAMAETLGRTPTDNIVEFESCGAWVCTYDVCF